MSSWKVTLCPAKGEVKILIADFAGDILKARLPAAPEHPRALLTFLEGMALWSGEQVHAAVFAADSSSLMFDGTLFGSDFWPVESAMVRFDFLPAGARRRLKGMGDFRPLYASGRQGGRP